MEAGTIQMWVAIALGVINLGGWGWTILQSPAKQNAEAVEKLAAAIVALSEKLMTRIDAVERRTSTLEDAYKHLPDKESIHRLEINMEKLSGTMGTMGAEMKAVRDISVMTRDFVMNQDAA